MASNSGQQNLDLMVTSSWYSSKTKSCKPLHYLVCDHCGEQHVMSLSPQPMLTLSHGVPLNTASSLPYFHSFSMLFSAGLVPSYIVTTQLLQLGDTIGALIIPMLLSPFNIILMRTFFKRTIPEAILESARIDGASETRIFFQICLPLSLPGIATISLFTALGFWNDWFNALLYIKSDNLYPLQYLLMQIQNNMDYIAKNVGVSGQLAGAVQSIPRETGRMAMVVVATVPIAILYPFFQRYFVKGLTIGGVKE